MELEYTDVGILPGTLQSLLETSGQSQCDTLENQIFFKSQPQSWPVFPGTETPIFYMYILTKKISDWKIATCQCATPMLCSYGFLLRNRS